MHFFDGLIIFVSGYLAKSRLSLLKYVLLLTLLPMASIFIMIAEIMYPPKPLDFYGYLVLTVLTGVSFTSVWVLQACYSEDKKVELAMYFVTGIVVLISLALFALVEVLPEDTIVSVLRLLISQGHMYEIWSQPPYQLAHFVIMAGSFPYVASFIISKMILKFRSYHFISIDTVERRRRM